ncbi:MAG: SAM-dependent methyltransferase [Saprospiraceae bacterium]|nr:MAG: SAM-dependent methyltransferase [Saprospiraceae bacterium]
MSNQTLSITPELYDYLLSVSLREHPVQASLRAETMKLAESEMQISPEQGQFMQFLVKLMGAKRTLEVGVFTGYSALSVALALPSDGQIIACDISEKWTSIGRRHWQRANVASKIDLRLAPAIETLQQLVTEEQSGTFDFAFIDADKPGYDDYYELCLKLIRTGGLILFDNTLWSGRVARENLEDENVSALRALNKKLLSDERIDLSLLPLSDGVTLVRKA